MAKIKLNNLEYFTNKIAASLPIDAEHVKEEFKDNLKPLLKSIFEKFEIVSREEFEIQKEILRKTRSKVDQLEKIIGDLD